MQLACMSTNYLALEHDLLSVWCEAGQPKELGTESVWILRKKKMERKGKQ